MVTLTDSARDAVREMTQDGGDESGVRIAAEGESGGGLSMSVVPAPADGDTVVDEDGSRVFLEPVAAQMLDGKVIDAERHDDHVHFRVGNPASPTRAAPGAAPPAGAAPARCYSESRRGRLPLGRAPSSASTQPAALSKHRAGTAGAPTRGTDLVADCMPRTCGDPERNAA